MQSSRAELEKMLDFATRKFPILTPGDRRLQKEQITKIRRELNLD